jgi:hypothetical protein
MDLGYQGSRGRQLPYSRTLAALPGTGTAGLPFFGTGRTAFTTERSTGLNSDYNSLQVNLTKRFASGLAFTGAYTFSKALDYGFDLLDPFTRQNNYGVADWDRTHILAVSHLWQLPFGAGTPYANSGWVGHVLGNWELNGILRWATGTPYTVTADPLLCACPGVSAVRANLSGPASINGQANFDRSLFSSPSSGFGDLGRNVFRGPDLFTYNLALFRNFQVKENLKLELRAEAYNLTNTTNYINPVTSLNSPAFGRTLGTFNGIAGRQFQLGGRFLF